MNNKVIGAIFCFISAIFISTKYIAAAIFMNGVSSWSSSLFAEGLESVGYSLTTFSVIALIIGLLFLGYGVYQDIKENKK